MQPSFEDCFLLRNNTLCAIISGDICSLKGTEFYERKAVFCE